MGRARDKGTRWETRLLGHLTRIWPDAERTGSRAYEIGDFARTGPFVIEAKNHKKLNFPAWLDQARDAAARVAEDPSTVGPVFPVVMTPRRNHTVDKAYVVMDYATFEALMADYYDEEFNDDGS